MPKYAALIYGEEADQESVSPEEGEQLIADYMEFGQTHADSIVGGEALHGTSTATTVQVEGGKGGNRVVTDGPFAETKEALGGFYLLDVPDLDTALNVAQDIPGAWHGRVEVRPLMEFDDEGRPVSA